MGEILRPISSIREHTSLRPVQQPLTEKKIPRARGGSRWRRMMEMAPKTSEESISRLLQVVVIPLFNPDTLMRKRRIFTSPATI